MSQSKYKFFQYSSLYYIKRKEKLKKKQEYVIAVTKI